MTEHNEDCFDLPVKPGFTVGVKIIVVSGEGVRLSGTTHEIHGADNSQADQVAADLLEQVKKRVQQYSEFKSGPWIDFDEALEEGRKKKG